ncbi:MAG: YigZ family protein [Aggregatilineales bacterium]
MADKYYRPAARQRSEIVVVNSRFITTIDVIETPQDARTFIGTIRDEMPDASHHVYAFRAGYGNSITEGMSDDGEPSGTSGPPTLAVLRGSDIGDIALVTTRYFGGTKLGTGGLVRAYSEAARTALEALKTELKAPKVYLGMDIPYALYTPVKRLLKQYDVQIEDEIFAGDITILCIMLEEQVEDFEFNLTELSAGQIELLRM